MASNFVSCKGLQYTNLCNVVNLMITIAGSNSAVERALSVLHLLLHDCCLSMSHETMGKLCDSEREGLKFDGKRNKISWYIQLRCFSQEGLQNKIVKIRD